MSSFNANPLPFSGGRYCVSQSGVVFDSAGEKIPATVQGGKLFVTLNWYDGERAYEIGLVVLCAYGKIFVGDGLFHCVDVVYMDGDYSNCVPANLHYVFAEPVQANIPGFFLIPGYSNYAISRSGDIINLVSGNKKKWSFQKGPSLGTRLPGYAYCGLSEHGRTSTVYQHRLLCLVFKKFSGVFNDLTVNHIDGDKTNNQLDNLEWVTYSENLRHAWCNDLRFKNRSSVLMRNLLTEEVLTFRSLRECGKFLGDRDAFYVSQRLKNQSGALYPDYLLFKFDDGSPWPTVNSAEIPTKYIGMRNDIVVRNVFTGDLYIFDNCLEVEKEFHVPAGVVLDHCRNNKMLPYCCYNFRFLTNSDQWPKHTRRHLAVYEESPKYPRDAIVMTDVVDCCETFFTTIQACINAVGIEKSHLNTLIYNGRLYKKRFSFKYFKLKEELLEKSISSEGH